MKYKPGFDASGICAGGSTPTTGTDPVFAMFPSAFSSIYRKKFTGRLVAVQGGTGQQWQVEWSDEKPAKPGQKVSKKRVPAPLQVLGFELSELREARLSPVVNFKGRSADQEA